MGTRAKKLLEGALIVTGVLAVALVLVSLAYQSCALTSGSSGTVYHDPPPNLDEESRRASSTTGERGRAAPNDPCVAIYERLMVAATEEGVDIATVSVLAAEAEECSGPGEVRVLVDEAGRTLALDD